MTSQSRSNIDNNKTNETFSFLKEIDEGISEYQKQISNFLFSQKELNAISVEPNSFEEAKSILNLKNNIIVKMRNHIANVTSDINKDSGVSDTHQNIIQYLKYEVDRLENKLLLLHTELDVEKTRAEQIKEVKDTSIQLFYLFIFDNRLSMSRRSSCLSLAT